MYQVLRALYGVMQPPGHPNTNTTLQRKGGSEVHGSIKVYATNIGIRFDLDVFLIPARDKNGQCPVTAASSRNSV